MTKMLEESNVLNRSHFIKCEGSSLHHTLLEYLSSPLDFWFN